MRFVSAIGAAVFAYLALIAFAFGASTWDNACAGPGCESAPTIKALLTILSVSCLLSLGATVSLFAVHALTGSPRAFASIPTALKVSGSAIGITLFFFVCLLSPVIAAVLIVTAIVTWQLLYRYSKYDARRERAEAEIRRKLGPPPSNPELN
jgi:heme/copper-type cytochrome/quinol oxidase subunit 2